MPKNENDVARCQRKRHYETRAIAKRMTKKLKAKKDHQLDIYLCPVCGRYALTHKTKLPKRKRKSGKRT